MGSEISPELVERCVALVRRVASHMNEDMPPRTVNLSYIKETCLEAEALVAELPEPVDPDLIEAREIGFRAAVDCDPAWASRELEYLAGDWDRNPKSGVSVALAAIKRGRELQKEGR